MSHLIEPLTRLSEPAALLWERDATDTGCGAPAELRRFGPFSLRNHGESLYRGNKPVRIGSRARQILAIMTAAPGAMVSKRELMEKVWPDTTVEENNLTVHIAALRQALGDGRDGAQYIVNVPRRGYRFVAPVSVDVDPGAQPAAMAKPDPPTNLPLRLTPAVGLDAPISDVRAKLSSSRLVTLCGPAGVGKTTLALHVAQSQRTIYPDGVWLADLATIGKVGDVASAVAAALRIETGATNATAALVRALTNDKTLLLLDTCEHVIDAVADLVTIIMRWCPDVVILTTSREALRVSGEATYVLAPLDAPPDGDHISAEHALAYPAVQLLVERVTAATNQFALSNEDALCATRICRRMDGLPLALEFASALVGAFSLAEVAARLDDVFKLIQTDMRGAPPRHRTLTAALDWSYGLLTDVEKTALRRLAVFVGGFTLEGASALTRIQDVGEAGALLATLHSKSLITRDIASKELRFALLETTRAYGLAKLDAGGEAADARRDHARYFDDVLRRRRLQPGAGGEPQDVIELDNVLSALRFASGPRGDADLARSLSSNALAILRACGVEPAMAAMKVSYDASNAVSGDRRRPHRRPAAPVAQDHRDQAGRTLHLRKPPDPAAIPAVG